MHLFLTSSPSGDPFVPGPPIPVLDESNGFVRLLEQAGEMFAVPPACLMLAADPDDFARNDEAQAAFAQCFANAGLPFSQVWTVDRRNAHLLPTLVKQAGFVLLHGGHVPTQNRFFREIRAGEALRGFEGIVLGISAGSMNAAGTVYAQPEEPGEAIDPHFNRWLPGLSLTDLNIWPHFEHERYQMLDGLRLLEDVAYPDSRRHWFLAIPDGSFVYTAPDGTRRVYGEAYRVENGTMTQICANGESVSL